MERGAQGLVADVRKANRDDHTALERYSFTVGQPIRKNMKYAMMIGAIALMGVGAQAQDDKMEPMDKAWVVMNAEKLNVELGLNDAQKAQVKEIDERYVKKHDALEAIVPKLTDHEMADRVERLMNERDKDLRVVLNDEQYAKWDKMRHKGTSELREDQKEKMKK